MYKVRRTIRKNNNDTRVNSIHFLVIGYYIKSIYNTVYIVLQAY